MIVEMMKPDASKSAAIATFEALCNFWRTFRWLVDTRVKLRKMVATRLMGFVKEENNRWAWCSFFVVVVTCLSWWSFWSMEFFASVLLYFTTINDGPLPLCFASLLEKKGHHIYHHIKPVFAPGTKTSVLIWVLCWSSSPCYKVMRPVQNARTFWTTTWMRTPYVGWCGGSVLEQSQREFLCFKRPRYLVRFSCSKWPSLKWSLVTCPRPCRWEDW